MIEQNVQVVRCQNDGLWVRMGSQSGCTACDNGNGCGAGLFAKLLRGKPVIIELPRNDMKVEPGQMLTLSLPEQAYVKLILACYGWPLLAALAGVFAGHSLGTWLQFGPMLLDLGALFCGLLVGGFVMRLIRNRSKTGDFLSSLKTTVYFSSATPNMCNGSPSSSTAYRE